MPKQTFDLHQALLDSDLQFEQLAENGNPMVKDLNDPEGANRELDLQKLLSDLKINPEEVDIQFNTTMNPVDESAIGFKTGVQLALARTKQDRARILEQEYGAENVQVNDLGEVSIKQGGVWKRADASFLQNLAAESGVTAGGIAGFAAGAKAGAAGGTLVAGPAGTIIGGALGGIFGGAVGATMGRLGTIEASEAMGIRTEADAEAVREELGKEFVNSLIWDTALLGAGKIIKPLAKGGAKVVRRGLELVSDKRVIAETAQQVMRGTKRFDWETVLRSSDDAKAVLTDMDRLIKWDTARAAGKIKESVDPLSKSMNNITTSFMQRTKKAVMRDFGQAMDHLERNGAFRNARINIGEVFSNLDGALKQAGVIDDVGRPLSINKALKQGDFVDIFDSASRNKLQKMYLQLKNVNDGAITHIDGKEARRLIQSLDSVLENSGVWKNGDLAITNEARQLLKTTRNNLRTELGNGFKNLRIRDIKNPDARVNAAQIYNDANIKYSKFRDTFDDFDLTKAIDKGEFNQVKIRSVIDKMLGEGGADLERRFGTLADLTGNKGQVVMTRLKQLRAAKNLSQTYEPASSGLGNVITQRVFGITGPREGAQFAAKLGRTIDSQAAAPVTRATQSSLKRLADASQFLKNLPVVGRLELMSNPELYRTFIQSIGAADQLEEQLTQDLLQGTGM